MEKFKNFIGDIKFILTIFTAVFGVLFWLASRVEEFKTERKELKVAIAKCNTDNQSIISELDETNKRLLKTKDQVTKNLTGVIVNANNIKSLDRFIDNKHHDRRHK